MIKSKPITALKVLSEMDAIQRRLDSPSIPPNYIVGTKYKEASANDIEKAIERFAKIAGFMAERTKTQGRKMDATYINTDYGRVQTSSAKFVTSTSRKGSSDMKLVINGKAIACEIKYGRDTQKKDQKQYQSDFEKAGGYYFIVKTFEEFLIWYVKNYGRPKIMQMAIDKLKPQL